jgi:phasin family protein
MANNPRHSERELHSERESTEGVQTAARRTAEQATRAMADATERTAQAGVESIRRNAENVSSHWRSNSEAANRLAERSMDQFSKMFGIGGDAAREAMQRSSGNVQALIDGTTIAAGGLQNVAGEWMRFAQSRIETNLDHLDDLMGCRTMHDCLALQTEIVRDNFEALMQSARRAAELSTQVADEAMRKIGRPPLAPQ